MYNISMQEITSKTNSTVKTVKKLLVKKHRKSSYLIEGWHLFEEAQKAGSHFEKIFVLKEFVDRVADLSSVFVVTPEIIKELSDSPTPQGIVAEVRLTKEDLPETLSGKYLFLEDVQDPGNVGTMIRTADAAGFEGIFLSDKSADIYNLKTLRSMQGSHFHLPVWRLPVSEVLSYVKVNGLSIVATTLVKDSVDYKDLPDLSDFVLVMGNEGQGISEEMVQAADRLVHITMPGQAESLNVAVAAGILMFRLI